MNKNILVSEVPGGGGVVHGGHIQPTDYWLCGHKMATTATRPYVN